MTDRVSSMLPPDYGTDDMNENEGVHILLITGMSGAGKTSALKAVEDLGYEAVDNMPLSLLGSLVARSDSRTSHPIAIGVDIRNRDFGVDTLIRQLDGLASRSDIVVKVLFMDCDDDELRRRYDETRHRHPLAQDRPASDGIQQERGLVSALRQRADLILDTTGMAPGELKHILHSNFGDNFGRGNVPELTVSIISFSFRHGLPRDADLVFDVRFLSNPHYDRNLRGLTGLDSAVGSFISADAGFGQFFDGLTGLLLPLLPRYAAEGKSYLAIAVGCTGGRHRSVFVAEKLATWLKSHGQTVHIRHRDMPQTAIQ